MLAKTRSTRVDRAYERLKREILDGVMPPGQQTPEPDIARRLGMSRTPVREALIRLEGEGLVELVPRRGARVVSISHKDLSEIFQMLAVLEALAASCAARLCGHSNVLHDMETVLGESRTVLRARDIGSWAMLDDTFHRLVAAGCGNDRLEAKISGLLDQVFRASSVLLRLNQAPASNANDHREIYLAIKAGDSETASELARDHRLTGLDTMRRLLHTNGLSEI